MNHWERARSTDRRFKDVRSAAGPHAERYARLRAESPPQPSLRPGVDLVISLVLNFPFLPQWIRKRIDDGPFTNPLRTEW